jgi:spore maturation protein CgeB
LKPRTVFFLNHLSCYLNSLADSLSQMGHRVCYQTSWNFAEIEAGLRHFRPELLLTVGYDKAMHEAPLERVPELCEKYRIAHVYWATEDRIHFELISRPMVNRLKPDLVWTIHPACVPMYNRIGLAAAYFNFAFNPRRFPMKHGKIEETYDVVLIGHAHLETRTYRYESLRQLLYPLIRSGLRTDVWGGGWNENAELLLREYGAVIPPEWLHGPVPYLRTAELYRQSRIVLGVQNAEDQVTQRTFEILGTGAFMIASRTPELETLFEHGQELVLSSGPEETLELVRHYRDRAGDRAKIGARARAKVLDLHTYRRRLRDVWALTEPHIEAKGR